MEYKEISDDGKETIEHHFGVELDWKKKPTGMMETIVAAGGVSLCVLDPSLVSVALATLVVILCISNYYSQKAFTMAWNSYHLMKHILGEMTGALHEEIRKIKGTSGDDGGLNEADTDETESTD